MPGKKRDHLLVRMVTLTVAATLATFGLAQKPSGSAGFYTNAQADAGSDSYQAKCASCHAANLHGGGGPTLAGPAFMTEWGARTSADLFAEIHDSMPKGDPGTLSNEDASDIAAFILRTNGLPAGTQPLTMDSAMVIGAAAPGGQEGQPAEAAGTGQGRRGAGGGKGMTQAAAEPAGVQDIPVIPFTDVPNFFKLPAGDYFGEVPGIATDSKGNIYVFTRSNPVQAVAYAPTEAQLYEFDKNGNFMREIGRGSPGFAFAHSVRIDRHDNIWTTDKGSDVVTEFNQRGQIVKILGRRKESSDEGAKPWGHPNPPLPAVDGAFRQVTDIGFDSHDNIYVTDGYIDSRVAKFDKDGNWVKSWGTKGSAPGQFNLPHQVVVDDNDNVYIGDRNNRRIQVFDTDGNFKRQFTIDTPAPDVHPVVGNQPHGAEAAHEVGMPNSICITKGPNQVLYVGEGEYPGRIFKVALDGKVLGMFGHVGRAFGQFSGAHALACPTEDVVYVGQSGNWRADKLIMGKVPKE